MICSQLTDEIHLMDTSKAGVKSLWSILLVHCVNWNIYF